MNNDRFKFRVFDNERGEYIKTDELAVISKDGELFLIICDFVETDDDAYGTSSVEKPDGCYTIEQSTGLRDRNGKLIYEGDICAFASGRFAVEWCNGGFDVFVKEEYFNANEVEIVGNIHEVKE